MVSLPEAHSTAIGFGRDAYLQGLLASVGQQPHAVPSQLDEVFNNYQAERAVIVIVEIDRRPPVHQPDQILVSGLGHLVCGLSARRRMTSAEPVNSTSTCVS